MPVNEADYKVIDATAKHSPGLWIPTPFVFGGYREEEFAWRMRGTATWKSWSGVAALSTNRATRTATEEELVDSARKRLDAMLRLASLPWRVKAATDWTETELKQLR